MISEELKLSLLKEHARDKRLTYTAYILILVIIAAVLIVFGKLLVSILFGGGEQTSGEIPAYVRYMLMLAVASYVGYGVWKIVKLNKQEKLIEELIDQIHSGSKATNIVEAKEYKIIIWLGKITYKMCPVEYFKLYLDTNPGKVYTIAVHPAYMTDFKNFLSGVDMGVINEKIADLYSDDANVEYNAAADTPLKTMEEYKEYLKTELGSDVESIESSRKSANSVKKLLGTATGIVAVAYVGYMIYNMYSTGGQVDVTKIIIPIAIIFGAYYIIYFLFLKPKVDQTYTNAGAGVMQGPEFEFKDKVFGKIVKFVSPGAEYVMHGHVSVADLAESGLFSRANYSLTGNDLIVGRHQGVPFQFCDLTVEVQQKFTRENDDPTYAFYGQFFMARFNKSFNSPVYIFPKTGVKGFFSANEASTYMEHQGEKIQLEDPDFMKMFNVYGADQIEARYILTPSLMERIKELAVRTKGQFYIAFYNNRITVANNSGTNNFEIKSNKSITDNDYKVMTDFYQDLCDQFAIIDDLKLNIKIWK